MKRKHIGIRWVLVLSILMLASCAVRPPARGPEAPHPHHHHLHHRPPGHHSKHHKPHKPKPPKHRRGEVPPPAPAGEPQRRVAEPLPPAEP